MKLSIVMSHFERHEQLGYSLKTIEMTKYINNDIEIIVVDDASSEIQPLLNIIDKFKRFNINLVLMDRKSKWWTNPCIPFNEGINRSTGEIIILQNPECLHFGDIISDVLSRITEDNYLTYSCFALSKNSTNIIQNFRDEDLIKGIELICHPFGNFTPENNKSDDINKWYNHPSFRPCAYHFCSAITKNNLNKLGGFDPDFAKGIGYDDNEILYRINKMGLKVNILGEDSPIVIHQWHKICFTDESAMERNRQLFLANKDRRISLEKINER